MQKHLSHATAASGRDDSFVDVYDGWGRAVHEQPGREGARQAFRDFLSDGESEALFAQSWIPTGIAQEMQDGSGYAFWQFALGEEIKPSFQVEIAAIPVNEMERNFVVRRLWLEPKHVRLDHLRTHMLLMARQACIGALGGPIAHALNNPLATIRGFAEVLRRRFDKIDKVGYFSGKIVNNSDRMRDVIEQLRALSRPSESCSSPTTFQLECVITAVLEVMAEQFKMRNIDVELKLEPELPLVKGDPALWEALFLSLLALARDTFQALGDDRKKKVSLEGYRSGENLCLIYRDTAGGFPDVSSVSTVDPLDVLANCSPLVGTPAFVVLEVLRRHDVITEVRVEQGDTTEISMELLSSVALVEEAPDIAI